MQEKVNIYGTDILLPEKPNRNEILYSSLHRKEQKWVKKELPSFFQTVEYNKNGDLILTKQQEIYADEEVRRCKKGIWVSINGIDRFFTGKYYFFLQYYILEDGISPDFREADREYFLFHDYWQKIGWCLGTVRTKKRRQGASSQACSNILYESIFYKSSNCGLISKTKDDSKDTFTQMVASAYRQLPAFLKPKQVNKEDSVTELVFAHKSENIKEGVTAAIRGNDGNNSRINYKAPVINAYDRGRMSYVLADEFGKLPKDVPASQLLSILSKTLVKGVKKVGWVDMPSTTNDLLKGGGMEFLKIWKSANQFQKRPTTNRLVRFFQPSYIAYEGFIDEYGDSVIDEPTEEQYNYLVEKWVKRDEVSGEISSELSEEDIKKGAKHYVLVTKRIGLEGVELEEEQRQNPCNEDEAFQSTSSDCHFNPINIKKQLKIIEEKPPVIRTVTFYRNLDQKVEWRDDESGFWQILEFPKTPNAYKLEDKKHKPLNVMDYVMGVDGYSASQGGRKHGSKASAFIMNRKTMQFIAMYFGRPRTKELMHEQMLLAGEYYGTKIWFEKTADSYFEYFKDRGRLAYLGKYPLSCIEPDKKENSDRWYGFPINPFAMTRQLDLMIAYVDNDKTTNQTYCDKIFFTKLLEQLLIFEAESRTDYDAVVAAMITLCCALEPVITRISVNQPLIKIYPTQKSIN